MKKRITWKAGALIVIELENGLFTVAQMIANTIMRFYDIKSHNDDWENINWPEVKPLFLVFVGTAASGSKCNSQLIVLSRLVASSCR